MNEMMLLELDGWTALVRSPDVRTPTGIFLLLHGYTGNEKSMTVFTRNLPASAWIIQPRGPYPTSEGGYKWIDSPHGLIASFAEFQKAIEKLNLALGSWKSKLGLPEMPLDVIGFSQGAVAAMVFTITFPALVRRAACLSGFIPDDTLLFIQDRPLEGKPIFMAHGTEDTTVPFHRAQKAETILNSLGAEVTFCTAAVGHRISAGCYRRYTNYFRQASDPGLLSLNK